MKIAAPAKFALIIMLFTSTQLFAQSKPVTILPGSYNNIYDLLREIPGLEVKPSTDKSGGTVVIRGIGSLTNQRNPLIVVDGVIYTGDLSAINPKDVDGIDVLKDASSAAAFGYSSLYISWYEQQGRGLQLSDISTSPIPGDQMNFSWSIIMMFLDGVIYGILGWYVKNVFPS